MEPFILIIIGILGGLIAGSMGVGGGIIFTPVLYFLFDSEGIENPVQWSVASGLLCTFVAASTSTIQQALHNNLFIKEGIMLGVFGAAGITAGKFILTSGFYQQEQFAVLFSAVLFYAAFMMFKQVNNRIKESTIEEHKSTKKEALITGGVGGFIASLAGVGGGGIMVPIMNLIYKVPFKKAVSVSHLGMTILIITGVIQLALIDISSSGISPYTFGYVDFGAALPLAFGGLIGANFGTILNHKIKRQYLQWGFAVLVTVMAVRLLWGVFG